MDWMAAYRESAALAKALIGDTRLKQEILEAYHRNHERFVKGIPVVKLAPKEVWINKPIVKEQQQCTSLFNNQQLSHSY